MKLFAVTHSHVQLQTKDTMSNMNHNRRRRSTIRLETLESRELLSVVGLPGRQHAEISPLARSKTQVIKMTLTGQGAVVSSSTTHGTTYFRTAGTTNLLGPTTFDGQVSYSATSPKTVKYSHGLGTLADLNGDAINVSLSGTGKTSTNYPFTVKGPVTGGAGKYAGAKGSVTGKGTLNNTTHTFTVQLTVTLTHM